MKTSANTIIGPAKVFKISSTQPAITRNALQQFHIGSGDRILLQTSNSGADAEWVNFARKQIHLTLDAAEYLVEQNVSCIGIDYVLDSRNPNSAAINELFTDNHISIIQGLRLADIEPGDYEMICLPVPATATNAAQSRVILKPGKKLTAQYA